MSCNGHPPSTTGRMGNNAGLYETNSPFASPVPSVSGDIDGFNWVELEQLELRARRLAVQEDGQMADLLEDLADTCELLTALVHHNDSLDNPGPQPSDIEEHIVHYKTVKTRREWSESEIRALIEEGS